MRINGQKIRNFLIIFCISYLIVCLFMLFPRHKFFQSIVMPIHTNKFVYEKQSVNWSDPKANIPPRKKSIYLNNKTDKYQKSLYIAVIDTEFKPHPYQCLMKKQWIDPILQYPFIEAIEFYSRIRWSNELCNITTIISPPSIFKETLNPTSWILLNTLKMFLERSNSDYVLIIGDSCYMKVKEFIDYFLAFHSSISGSCVEQRYFFQMLLIESGILLSRNNAVKIVSKDAIETWNVACEVGIDSDEAFSQILDQVGIHPKYHAEDSFLGREFRNFSDFKRLQTKSYDDLPICKIPDIYIHNPPGEQGICSAKVTKFNDVILWSAPFYSLYGKSAASKYEFLLHAELMLNNNSDKLGYYWAQSHPTLCKLE